LTSNEQLHRVNRHCERSEAIQLVTQRKKKLDCFVASLLAMTKMDY